MSDVAATQEFVPPSTGKRKKARRVFGSVLVNGDLNSSLSYTPSPLRTSQEMDDSHSSGAQQRRVATNLFSIAESTRGASTGDVGRQSESSSQESGSRSASTGKVVYKPFSKIMRGSEEEDKENLGNARVPRSINVQPENSSFDSKLSLSEMRESYSESLYSNNNESTETVKPDSCATQRAATRPQPTYPKIDKVKPNHKQSSKPLLSVNEAMNAAKRARESALKDKAKQAAMIRDQWREEKEEALSFNEESEKLRRQQLNLRNKLSSKFSKTKAQRDLEQRECLRKKAEQETIFKSDVAREHQQKLKEQEEKCRRQSMAIRAKIRANNRQGAERLKLARIEEDKVIYEERHNFSKAREEYLQDRAASVRKNYQFRAGDARKIRELHDKMETQRKNEEHESFELMLAAARDTDEYKKELAEQRRQSLASRNETSRKQRELAEIQRSEELAAEHERYELKWAGESDADRYKWEMEEKRRQSLAFHNAEAREYRERQAEQQAKEQHAEHCSYELKFDAERDVEAYRREQGDLRRKSLEQRGQFTRMIKEKMSAQESQRLQAEHESYELKFAAKRDVELYQKEVKEERRKSKEFRNKEAKRQREGEESRRAKQLELEHKSYELKWDGERDATAYLKSVQEERRQSLERRGMEARKQREIQDSQRTAALQAEHESYELKRAACKDVDEYNKKMAEERRESLAFRNKENARHAKVMEELQALAKEQEADSYMLKWAAEDDAKAYLAKMEEERRKSLRLRGEEARGHREIEDEMRNNEIIRNQEDEALRSAGQQDVEKYKRECAERDRASLEFRRKEAMIRNLEESNRAQRQREEEEKNFELETLARLDVQEYAKKCANQRRKSLAFRAKEKRRHAEVKRRDEAERLQQQSQDARLRARDSRSMELARQKEKMRIATEALRHADCTFSNPFAGLYD